MHLVVWTVPESLPIIHYPTHNKSLHLGGKVQKNLDLANISLEGEYNFINLEDKNQGQNSYHANTGNLFVKINF